MTEDEAKSRARQVQKENNIPMEWELKHAELRYIQLGNENPDQPAPVRDLLAWVIRFTAGPKGADLAIEKATGQVVRVQRSR